MYTDSIPFFDKIASHGIPIRDPELVKKWARHKLFDVCQQFTHTWKNTISGVERSSYISETRWNAAIETGAIYPQFNRDKMASIWRLCDHNGPVPTFYGSVSDMDILKDYESDSGFAGDCYRLFKARLRLIGLFGGWLDSYRDGRLYYRSLHPFGCSTGRCAPRVSDGFLPAMGHEITDMLLSPPEGRCITILDFRSQGVSILAALSHDPVLVALAQAKKDPYLGLGKILGIIPKDEYSALPVDELKIKYKDKRDTLKSLMLAYQYGAGAGRLSRMVPSANGVNHALDTVFKVFVVWKKTLGRSLTLPDEYVATGESAVVTHVQGYDAYILRQIIQNLSLPDDAFIIATNHDCIWIEHPEGVSMEPVARQMESIADGIFGAKDLFRVSTEKKPHKT